MRNLTGRRRTLGMVALATVCVVRMVYAEPLGSQGLADGCAHQIGAAQEGNVPVSNAGRPLISALKQSLSGAAYHEAYRAGIELLAQPEFADGRSLQQIVAVLGRPDLMFADTGGRGDVGVYYNTNGGPLDLAFQRCALTHKAMDTPPHWRGTDAELAELWSKARHSREWWLWHPMTGTITAVAGPLSQQPSASALEVDLEGGMFGNTGNLSFALPDGAVCRGRWTSSTGPALTVTSGHLLSGYGPRFVPGAAVPPALGPGQSMGQAFIDCGKGRSIRLEFVTGPGTVHGWGIGEDNAANIFRFVF